MKHVLILSAALLFYYTPALALTTSECLDCHSDESLTREAGGRELSLYIDEGVFSASIHWDLDCTDCHSQLEDAEDEHDGEVEPVDCGSCHGEVVEEFAMSNHSPGNTRAPSDLPTCSSCHGKHNIMPGDNVRSMTYELNIPETCCTCHEQPEITGRHPVLSSEVCTEYKEGMHGIVLFKSGMIFSAVCNDCHGSHNIYSADDVRSATNRSRINSTCSSCHAGILDVYRSSIHGSQFEEGREDAPTCTSCHGTHRIDRAMDNDFLLTVTKRCSSCHEKEADTFKNTYHGQVTGMGYSKAAQCPDCHGAHNILPRDNVSSMVHPDNLEKTCGTCHPGANANFVKYLPHADYHDRENYPGLYYVYLAMVALLSGVFIFFGIHTAMWLVRAHIEERKKENSR